ncbi:MAG: hypothetical protein A2672_01150 [Candidatus Wildermuthbacteria bacterium RIFCSPHIGHO2_01_FULL_49_22b]|uniref:CxxC-x17-CxxC domain-containing protein n=1 Tax=Candidatus Wildermuthbacteria bacterium RIFCSPHIGHO2_01_FULL_49_22b TaxID=1802448 RepID=A0A1G2QZW6_9BACT|nr:MAG: hypothetical protein A2672_01150 [Candidatus Wildermuthbacteria bacterium RIFCSPHIGHO2_01_FULL_49_22b]
MKNFNGHRGNNKGHGNRGGSRFGGGRPSFGGRAGGARSDDRQMFEATCSECGKVARVPFRPTGDKPVFCRECFAKQDHGQDQRQGEGPRGGFGNDRGPRDHRPYQPSHGPATVHAPRPTAPDPLLHELRKQLDRMDSKLNQLLELSRGADIRKSLAVVEDTKLKPTTHIKSTAKAKVTKTTKSKVAKKK